MADLDNQPNIIAVDNYSLLINSQVEQFWRYLEVLKMTQRRPPLILLLG